MESLGCWSRRGWTRCGMRLPVVGAVGDRVDSGRRACLSVGLLPGSELTRRRPGGGEVFSAEYKLRIVREADACTRPGEIGALLRREGLYSRF